jgi:sulfite reductase alpha subunit-like flavoprotein
VTEKNRSDKFSCRIDGTLEPWLDNFADSVLKLYPLPASTPVGPTPKNLPPPRVILTTQDAKIDSSLSLLQGFLCATVKTNQRITAKDWYQDVRHIEFELDKDIE